MATTTTIHELEASEQNITKVIVFDYRAEVHRLVKTTLKPGINEIHLKNLCFNLVKDSLRVEGRGNAIIHDVAVQHQSVPNKEVDNDKIAALRATVKDELAIHAKLEDEKKTIQFQLSTLDKIVGNVGSGAVNGGNGGNGGNGSGTSMNLNDETFLGLQKLLVFYGNNAEHLKQQLRETSEKVEAVKERAEKVHQDLMHATHGTGQFMATTVGVITIEAVEEGEAELNVIYQVHGAGWSPSYDIRVDTSKPSMSITYFGKIRQLSKEDWTNAPLILSTAQPCLGGQIPELGTLEAVFHRRAQPHVQMHQRNQQSTCLFGSTVTLGPPPEVISGTFGAPIPQQMKVATVAEVVNTPLSAEFKIVRQATIPHGTEDHKVTIGVVTLVPKLVHESVPSKNAAAFLTASAVNSSEFAFLEAEASIFLNNAFVTKTILKEVSPGERFSCSLGVDTSIRVEYLPAKKYHEEGGYITKHSANVTEQRISIKNTRAEQPVLLTLKHHVPRSTDEKIRIKLIAPDAAPYKGADEKTDADSQPVEGAKLNSAHNLEWTVNVNAGEKKELLIKWVLEHSKDEIVDFVERH